MHLKRIFTVTAVFSLIAVPISLFAISAAGKRDTAEPGGEVVIETGAADPPPTRAEVERRRRFAGQFGEANAELAMAEADRLFDGIISRLNGPITVEGTVRSSDGSPLPEVQIEAGSGAASMSWYPEGGEEQELRTNGPIKFSADSVNWMQLDVRAPGFYPTSYRVRRDFDQAEFDKLMELGADVTWDSEALVVRDIEIVLTPVSDIPELDAFGSGVTSSVAQSPTHGLLIEWIGRKTHIGREIREWPTEQQAIVAIIPSGPDGEPIDWELFPIPQTDRTFACPPSIDLLMPEGWGIQLVDLDGEPAGKSSLVSGMELAPEDGYQRRITLTSQDLWSIFDRVRPSQKAIYFYFTSPLGYGKGMIQGPQGDAEDLEISWGMSFYLQPNGTRDTRTPPHQ